MICRLNFIMISFLLISGCKSDDAVFIEYINQFQESIQILEKQNDYIYNEFNYSSDENPLKIRPYYQQVLSIKKSKVVLLHFIDSIAINSDTLLSLKPFDIHTIALNKKQKKIDLQKSDIEQLNSLLLKFKSELLPNIRIGYDLKEYEESINKLFSGNKLDNLISFFGKSNDLIEFLAYYCKLKADITVGENKVLNLLFNQIDVGGFRFYKIEPIVEPNSEVVPIGIPYKANIFLSIIDTTISHSFEIDGKEHQTEGHKGYYSFQVKEKTGKYEKHGNFNVMRPYDSAIQKIPFKLEYEVLERK
jgi:hypothetical protein